MISLNKIIAISYYITVFILALQLIFIRPDYIALFGILLIVAGFIKDYVKLSIKRIYINTIAIFSIFILLISGVNVYHIIPFLERLVIIFIGIKSLEDKKPRDIYQVLILELMGFGIISVLKTSLIFIIGLSIWFFFSSLLLMLIELKKGISQEINLQKRELKFIAALNTFIFTATFLLGYFIFLIMPRVNYPLLGVGFDLGTVQTGFSNNLNPANATNVLKNDATVFRVIAKNGHNLPDLRNAYWRGEVLDYFNGYSWFHKHQTDYIGNITYPKGVKPAKLSILMEPSFENVLFSYGIPIYANIKNDNEIKPYITKDLTIATRYPVVHRILYSITSIPITYYKQDVLNLQDYLELPPNIDPSIKALANSLKGATPQESINNVINYFSKGFKYSLSNPNIPKDKILYDFLFKIRKGNCQLYASSTAVLLREIGIPARVVIGFLGAEYNKDGNYYFVTNSMAHAWVEAYVNGYWEEIDTTPYIANYESLKISKIRKLVDYVSYLWERNVVNYSFNDQKRLAQKGIEFLSKIKTISKTILIYAIIVCSVLYILYLFAIFILERTVSNFMYKKLIKILKEKNGLKKNYLTQEDIYNLIEDIELADKINLFLFLFLKERYSKEKLSKKEKELMKKTFREILSWPYDSQEYNKKASYK